MSYKIKYPNEVVLIPSRAQVRSVLAKLLQTTDVTSTTVAIKTTLLYFNKCSKDTYCMRLVLDYTCYIYINGFLCFMLKARLCTHMYTSMYLGITLTSPNCFYLTKRNGRYDAGRRVNKYI